MLLSMVVVVGGGWWVLCVLHLHMHKKNVLNSDPSTFNLQASEPPTGHNERENSRLSVGTDRLPSTNMYAFLDRIRQFGQNKVGIYQGGGSG